MPKIADLYVNLGVKEEGQAYKALKSIKISIADIASSAVSMKAALLAAGGSLIGAALGFKSIMTGAMDTGLALHRFSNFTGLSTEMLQRWQYVMRNAGVSADETENSIRSVQKIMDQMATGQGAPKGIQAIVESLTSMGRKIDINKMARDTSYAMNVLVDYAKNSPDKDARKNDWLMSMGLGENFIGAAKRNLMRLKDVPKSMIITERQSESLTKAHVAWDMMGARVNKFFADFASKDGLKIVDQIEKITLAVMNLATVLYQLASKLGFFEKFAGLLGWAAEKVSSLITLPEDMPKIQADLETTAQSGLFARGMVRQDIRPSQATPEETAVPSKLMRNPRSLKQEPVGQLSGPNITINMTNHGVKDAKEITDVHLKKAINHTVNNMPMRRGP